MGKIYNNISSESILAKEITIGRYKSQIFISENDEVYCYVGIWTNNCSKPVLESWPWHLQGKHSTDKQSKPKIKGFFRICQGCVLLDDFIDGSLNPEEKFKHWEGTIRFPVGSSIWYGAFRSYGDEDTEISHAVFGLTYDELYELMKGYAKIFGVYNDYFQFPRVTRYQQHDSTCDLCNLWIPAHFPYIMFVESSYPFSHVSLWGCYRHIQLLIQNDIDSSVGKLLIKAGVDKNILERLIKINDYNLMGLCYRAKMVTDDMIRNIIENEEEL